MSQNDLIEVEGTVVEMVRGGKYIVKLKNECKVTATIGGKLRLNKIMIVEGDNVKLSISPYDLTKGIITYRYK